MEKPKTFFDYYDEFKPAEEIVEKKDDDELRLFNLEDEENKPDNKVTLPENFEENLVNKITAAVLNKINEKGGENNG